MVLDDHVFGDGGWRCQDLAYYTLAVKPFSVKSSRLTARQKKEMKDLARICISREDKSYGIASYLIGQLAKNYAVRCRGWRTPRPTLLLSQ